MPRVPEWSSTRPVNNWEREAFEGLQGFLDDSFLIANNVVFHRDRSDYPEVDIIIVGREDFYLVDCKDLGPPYVWTPRNLSLHDVEIPNPLIRLDSVAKVLGSSLRKHCGANKRLGSIFTLLRNESFAKQNLKRLPREQRNRVGTIRQLVHFIEDNEARGRGQDLLRYQSFFDQRFRPSNKVPGSTFSIDERIDTPDLPELFNLFQVFNDDDKRYAIFYNHPPHAGIPSILIDKRETSASRNLDELPRSRLLPRINQVPSDGRSGQWMLLNAASVQTLPDLLARLAKAEDREETHRQVATIFCDWVSLVSQMHGAGWSLRRFESLAAITPVGPGHRSQGTLLDWTWAHHKDHSKDRDTLPFQNVLLHGQSSPCRLSKSEDWQAFTHAVTPLVEELFLQLDIEDATQPTLRALTELPTGTSEQNALLVLPEEIRSKSQGPPGSDSQQIESELANARSKKNRLTDEFHLLYKRLDRGAAYAEHLTQLARNRVQGVTPRTSTEVMADLQQGDVASASREELVLLEQELKEERETSAETQEKCVLLTERIETEERKRLYIQEELAQRELEIQQLERAQQGNDSWQDNLDPDADMNQIGSFLLDRLQVGSGGQGLPPFQLLEDANTQRKREGCWGRVYKVWPAGRAGSAIALKLARHDLDEDRLHDAKEVWQSECEAARRIMTWQTPDDAFVRIREVPAESDRIQAWIQMDWVDGQPISDYLEKGVYIVKAIQIIERTARTIQKLEAHGVHFLDLHANNVLLQKGTLNPVLIDPAAVYPGCRPPEWVNRSPLGIPAKDRRSGQVFLLAYLLANMLIPDSRIKASSSGAYLSSIAQQITGGDHDHDHRRVVDEISPTIFRKICASRDWMDLSSSPEQDARKLSDLVTYGTDTNPRNRPSNIQEFGKHLRGILPRGLMPSF
jgi:hypothetical protein